MAERAEAFVAAMDAAPVALVPQMANEQHYEVPAEFFALVLGAQRKYSCCLWPEGVTTLDAAEVRSACARPASAPASPTARRSSSSAAAGARSRCGWRSTIRLRASPQSPIRARSAIIIVAEAARRGLANVAVLTADMNAFATGERFDRVVSVEMFEHMRNWRALFARVAGWLAPGGRFFMHVFAHRVDAVRLRGRATRATG